MSVRLKLALTIFATGLLTALLVIATVVYAFQRFENETAYRRGMGFLSRVVSMYDNIFDMHEKDAAAFQAWLRALVLFEPDTELYLLDAGGSVLAKTGPTPLKPGTRVALAPVRESIEQKDASYVMGDDPERMDAGAVVVAKPVRRAEARGGTARRRLPVPRPAHAAAARRSLGRAAQQLRPAGARRRARRRRADDAARRAHHRRRDRSRCAGSPRRSRRCRSAASPKASRSRRAARCRRRPRTSSAS